MSGTVIGGRKARDKNYELHGEDFYREIGRKGGRLGHTGGFHGNSERAKLAGKRGGQNSKRGCEYLGEKDGVKRWMRKATGELIEETV